MKLHQPPKPIEIRITFRRQGYHPYEYIMLDDTGILEVEKFLKETIIKELEIDPFYKGKIIGIDIREYKGSKAGVSKSISIKHPIAPTELKKVILKAIFKK